MFKAKTVIILGAGASWHYGYPTGEELVKLVIDKARIATNYFRGYSSSAGVPLANRPCIVSGNDPAIPKDGDSGLLKQWTTATKCQDLIKRVEKRPMTL